MRSIEKEGSVFLYYNYILGMRLILFVCTAGTHKMYNRHRNFLWAFEKGIFSSLFSVAGVVSSTLMSAADIVYGCSVFTSITASLLRYLIIIVNTGVTSKVFSCLLFCSLLALRCNCWQWLNCAILYLLLCLRERRVAQFSNHRIHFFFFFTYINQYIAWREARGKINRRCCNM